MKRPALFGAALFKEIPQMLSAEFVTSVFSDFKKHLTILALLGCFFIFCSSLAQANALSVANVAFSSQDTVNHAMTIQFDMTWANAWRDTDAAITAATGNYDAAWVFVKYSIDSANTVWNHATLKATGGTATSSNRGIINPDGYSSGTATVAGAGKNVDIIVPTEATSGKKGAFVQIASQGGGSASGTLSATGIKVVWDYGTNLGTSISSDTTASLAVIDVMGIEMVYIPQGQFYVGSPTANTAGLSNPFYGATTTLPFQIATEGAITIANSAGNLWCASCAGNVLPDNSGYAGFPKGFGAFYIMKSEATQGQYRDFLNTLTRLQQTNHVYTPIGSGTTAIASNYTFVMSKSTAIDANGRNGIHVTSPIPASGPVTFDCDLSGTINGANDGEWIAASFLTWSDQAAYAAWSGLRPFTELEFEKAARGANAGAANTVGDGDFPWGTSGAGNITQGGGVTNLGTASEAPASGNCEFNSAGVLRVGCFAQAATTKAQAGASYYGVLDLAGNLWESIVSVVGGQGFTGSHGTGVLSVNGYATNADWPGISAGEVTGSGGTGAGTIGGSVWKSMAFESVADRWYASSGGNNNRNSLDTGIRLARTAP
ncbi:MAG: SUMF1/EgtB/PvdO family nonheme iron enzyme [Candidatus Omnitrophica bacterium]|nr:SUMF1/EgtB/PvdO family nonheme iron enzyme [Candidatus Omnitrophota bacterium]